MMIGNHLSLANKIISRRFEKRNILPSRSFALRHQDMQVENDNVLVKNKSQVTLPISHEELNQVNAVFAKIVHDLTENTEYTEIKFAMKDFKDNLEYNIPHGKLIRFQYFLAVYKALEHPENLTNENLELAMILGWCLEIVSKSELIT